MSNSVNNDFLTQTPIRLNGPVFFNIMAKMKRPVLRSNPNISVNETQLFNELVNLVLVTTNRDDIRIDMSKARVNDYKNAFCIMRFNKTKKAIYKNVINRYIRAEWDFSDDFITFSDNIVKNYFFEPGSDRFINRSVDEKRYSSLSKYISILLYYIANDETIADDTIFYMFNETELKPFTKSELTNKDSLEKFLSNTGAITIDTFLYSILSYIVYNRSVLSYEVQYHPSHESLKNDIKLFNYIRENESVYSDFRIREQKIGCHYPTLLTQAVTSAKNKSIIESLSSQDNSIIAYSENLKKYAITRFDNYNKNIYYQAFECTLDFCNAMSMYTIIFNGLIDDTCYEEDSLISLMLLEKNYSELLEKNQAFFELITSENSDFSDIQQLRILDAYISRSRLANRKFKDMNDKLIERIENKIKEYKSHPNTYNQETVKSLEDTFVRRFKL